MFNKLQQEKNCAKDEQKSNQEKGGLEVSRMMEIQSEQNIGEAENLMPDEAEVYFNIFL